MNIPNNLKYQKTDEWVKIDGNQATIGISDYAQDQLSDIVFVEFNFDPDDEIHAEDVIATIESVKAAGDVMSPLSGKILEVNESLTEKPETLNNDPYGDGWMLIIKLSDPSEADILMSSNEYEKYCADRD